MSTADGRSALLGWAYSPLRMRDLIRAALDDPLVDFPRSADVQVYDSSTPETILLYDSRIPERRDPRVLEGRQRRLQIYGRSWLLRLALPTTRGIFDLQSVLLAICGVLTSVGLGLGTGGLVRQHRRILANLRRSHASPATAKPKRSDAVQPSCNRACRDRSFSRVHIAI